MLIKKTRGSIFIVAKYKFFRAFTLAEVLITLTIIGIVAALTIPTLYQNYKNRAWDTAAEVFERKISEATKVMNSEMTLIGYNTTRDFVSELSKHIKIIKTCDSNDLTNCFAEKFYWGADNTEVNTTELTTSQNFGKSEYETELVGVMFANGVNAIMAYDKNCRTQDPYSNQINTTGCLAMVYDVDGYNKPNTFSKDLRAFNGVSIISGCDYYVNNLCLTTAFTPDPISEFGDEDTYRSLEGSMYPSPLNGSYSEWTKDYVSAAKYHCSKMGMSLPSESEMEKVVQYLYPDGKLDYDRLSKTPISLGSVVDCYVTDEQRVGSSSTCLNNGSCYFGTRIATFTNDFGGFNALIAYAGSLGLSGSVSAVCVK